MVKRRRSRLTRELSLARLPEDIVREHIEVMPAQYLLNEQPEQVARHVEQVIAVRKGRPSVTFNEHPESRITDMTVCAYDRHGLLSQITGVLYALDVTVHSARVRTRICSDAIAIDTLCVDFLGDRLPYFKRKEVERILREVLTAKCSAEDLIKSRGKDFSPGPEINSVHLTDMSSSMQAMLEVRAEDVPGLLYYITAAITKLGWNILSAKITTVGRTAIDAFTVKSGDVQPLPKTAANKLKKELSL
jgi:[protein-PII] uridylyltransferase